MGPLLQQMLGDNPLMQQLMTAAPPPGPAPATSLPGLPSSADLLQQAHALQLLAQLQSVLMMNNPLVSRIHADAAQVSFEDSPPLMSSHKF